MKKSKSRLENIKGILKLGWITDKIGLSKKDYIFGTLTAEEKKKRVIAFFLLPFSVISILALTSFFVSGSSDAETIHRKLDSSYDILNNNINGTIKNLTEVESAVYNLKECDSGSFKELKNRIEKTHSSLAEYEKKMSDMQALSDELKKSTEKEKDEITNKKEEIINLESDIKKKLIEVQLKEKELKAREDFIAEREKHAESVSENIEKCTDSLNNLQAKENECIIKIDNIERENEELLNKFLKLKNSLGLCIAEKETFREIISNSVRDVCCNFGDSESGIKKNWDISGKSIICSGNYNVDCSTGFIDWEE